MPAYGPTKRRLLIAVLRKVGFETPRKEGKHWYMRRGNQRLPIPNEHGEDISVSLLNQILTRAGISREEWERL